MIPPRLAIANGVSGLLDAAATVLDPQGAQQPQPREPVHQKSREQHPALHLGGAEKPAAPLPPSRVSSGTSAPLPQGGQGMLDDLPG